MFTLRKGSMETNNIALEVLKPSIAEIQRNRIAPSEVALSTFFDNPNFRIEIVYKNLEKFDEENRVRGQKIMFDN